MNKTDSIAELAKALAKAQGEIENASKNAANPHFKSKYADLAEVLNTVRPVFSSHGLSVLQMPSLTAVSPALKHCLCIHPASGFLTPVPRRSARTMRKVSAARLPTCGATRWLRLLELRKRTMMQTALSATTSRNNRPACPLDSR